MSRQTWICLFPWWSPFPFYWAPPPILFPCLTMTYWLTSPGSWSRRGFWNLVSFLWKTVIWSLLVAWSCCFLDKINHVKLALTIKLEPSSVFFFLSPTWSPNVLSLRPLLATRVGGERIHITSRVREPAWNFRIVPSEDKASETIPIFQTWFTNNFLLNTEKVFL